MQLAWWQTALIVAAAVFTQIALLDWPVWLAAAVLAAIVAARLIYEVWHRKAA